MPSRSVSVPAAARASSSSGGIGPDDFERPDERLRLEAGVVGPIEAVHHSFEGVDRGHLTECR